jgi:hypothetical protein
MKSTMKRYVIGPPLKSEGLAEEKLSKLKALAILSSDALSSVAYGTEQILIVLMAVGFTALWYSIPISLAVLGLLTILILSYRQTIFAYPTGGGAYIVSKENLGVPVGLLAGGSLLVDYILTVAVSISAGTDAITSAFPALHDYRVLIALVMIAFLNNHESSRDYGISKRPCISCLFVCLIDSAADYQRHLSICNGWSYGYRSRTQHGGIGNQFIYPAESV